MTILEVIIQSSESLMKIANTSAKEVTIIGIEAVIIIIVCTVWYRREMQWEKKSFKMNEELKTEIRSHSEELKKANEQAINMGTRFMTMIQLKENQK